MQKNYGVIPKSEDVLFVLISKHERIDEQSDIDWEISWKEFTSTGNPIKTTPIYPTMQNGDTIQAQYQTSNKPIIVKVAISQLSPQAQSFLMQHTAKQLERHAAFAKKRDGIAFLIVLLIIGAFLAYYGYLSFWL